uniref:Uncharacterized protein n=1 Tax=Salvator merianae TaxID=96440 RepID=A0A8D0B5J9_SALMN
SIPSSWLRTGEVGEHWLPFALPARGTDPESTGILEDSIPGHGGVWTTRLNDPVYHRNPFQLHNKAYCQNVSARISEGQELGLQSTRRHPAPAPKLAQASEPERRLVWNRLSQ